MCSSVIKSLTMIAIMNFLRLSEKILVQSMLVHAKTMSTRFVLVLKLNYRNGIIKAGRGCGEVHFSHDQPQFGC